MLIVILPYIMPPAVPDPGVAALLRDAAAELDALNCDGVVAVGCGLSSR